MALPPLRPGYPAPPDLAARRARMPATWTEAMLEQAATARDATIGGVACLICEPADANGAILYFHGGGYRLGSPAGWANFGARLAVATGKRVIVPDYRLAPEYPFPAALHDAVSVYRALLDDGAAPLVGGDSAGGGLAAALVLACADLGLPAPAGLVLLSPWVDLTVTAPTYDSRATTDQLFPRESAGEAAAQYLQSHDTDDKLASPLNGDLSGFPPTLIFASADECLLGDSLALQARLAEARREVALHVAPGMPHVWPVIMPAAAQTRAAFETIKAFVATQDYAARM